MSPWASGDSLTPSTLNAKLASAASVGGFSTNTLYGESTVSVSLATGITQRQWYLQTENYGHGQLYPLYVTTKADIVDTAAGIAIVNTGKADALYINLSGPAASSPTGIGIDVNPTDVAVGAAAGIRIFDKSVANIGEATAPFCIEVHKTGNSDTSHQAVVLRGNRNMLVLQTQGGASFTTNAQLFKSTDSLGAIWWAMSAGGDQTLRNGVGIYFNMLSGNQGYIQSTINNQLDLRAGAAGLRILNSSGLSVLMDMNDAGRWVQFYAPSIHTDGAATNPGIQFTSDNSLGFYRSAVSTIKQSYGTLDLSATNLSLKTTGVSQTSLTIPDGGFQLFIGGTSGATLAARSGGTIYFFASSASTKG